MSFMESDLNGKCVYWAPGSKDVHNKMTYTSPVEIDCRIQVVDAVRFTLDGEEHIVNTVAYPDRVLERKGFLRAGLLGDLPSEAADPTIVDGAFEIVMSGDSNDVEGIEEFFKVWLRGT